MSAQSHSRVIGICHKSWGTNGCWKDDIFMAAALLFGYDSWFVKADWSRPSGLSISWKSCPNSGKLGTLLFGCAEESLVAGLVDSGFEVTPFPAALNGFSFASPGCVCGEKGNVVDCCASD